VEFTVGVPEIVAFTLGVPETVTAGVPTIVAFVVTVPETATVPETSVRMRPPVVMLSGMTSPSFGVGAAA
jgi:hypothetical protein